MGHPCFVWRATEQQLRKTLLVSLPLPGRGTDMSDEISEWLRELQHEFRNSYDFKTVMDALVKRRDRELAALHTTTEENE